MFDRIFSNVPRSDCISFFQTSSAFHDIAARNVYRRVKVSGRRGRKLLDTLISTNRNYGDLITTMQFVSVCACELYRTFPHFVVALSRLHQVRELCITVPPALSGYLLHLWMRLDLDTRLVCGHSSQVHFSFPL